MDVSEVEAKIKISDYFYGAAPVLIVNDLRQPVYYGQKDVTSWRSPQSHIHVLPPKHSAFFCWIEPMATVREFVYRMTPDSSATIGQEEEECVINLDFDKFATIENKNCGWVTFFDGKQRVLLFTYDPYLPQYLLRVCFDLIVHS